MFHLTNASFARAMETQKCFALGSTELLYLLGGLRQMPVILVEGAGFVGHELAVAINSSHLHPSMSPDAE